MLAGKSFVMSSPKVDRIHVCSMFDGRKCSFFLHEVELALLWARHMRRRWGVHCWLERENAPANLSELRLELAAPTSSEKG